MKLTEAKFCIDCEEIFKGAKCPACGGSHTIFLAKWITSLKPRRK
jgi:hypothetical protein